MDRRRRLPLTSWRARLAVLLIVALSACADMGGAGKSAPAPPAPAFYPPPPATPRIQHLARIATARDLGAPRGGFATFIAGKEEAGQSLVQPYGVALYDHKMYVADTKAGGLAVFDFEGKRLSLVTGTAGGRMKSPINVTIDADGTKYVTDTALNRVLVYDRADRFVRTLGEEGQFRPVDAAIVGNKLYVVDIQHHEVHVLDKRTGALLSKFGRAGSGTGELYHPTNICVAENGDVLVTETGNFRVQRFSAQGLPLGVYGKVGTAPGTFARPKGIALDRAGRMYVGDAAFQNVQIFDPTGQVLMDFGAPQVGVEGLNLPAAVKIDYDHVELFRKYADPEFAIEYLILVVSQYGPNKVDVFGFGSRRGQPVPQSAPTRDVRPDAGRM